MLSMISVERSVKKTMVEVAAGSEGRETRDLGGLKKPLWPQENKGLTQTRVDVTWEGNADSEQLQRERGIRLVSQ